MRKPCLMGLAALTGLSLLAVAALADEEEISVEELPAAVKKAVKKKFPEAKIRGASKEVEDGKTTFEVELKVEGHSVDVALNAKGKILEIEKEIPASKLPEAVKKRLAAKYPGAKIEKAEEITKGDGPVHYEVVIKAEVVFNAKGKVVQAKEEDEDDDKPAAKAKKKKEKDEDDDDDDEDEEDDDEGEVKGKKRDKD